MPKSKVSKWVSLGALMGLAVGVVQYFILPNLVNIDFLLNTSSRNSLGFANNYYDLKAGSIYLVGTFIPVLTGLIGAITGFLAYKLFSKK